MSASKASVARLAVGMVIALFGVGAFSWGMSYQQDINQWDSQIAGCQRGKKDRAANAEALEQIAKGFRTQRNYLKGVLVAQSVKEDVKRKARHARANFTSVSFEIGKSAESLRSRTGPNLDCGEAFPRPSPLPF